MGKLNSPTPRLGFMPPNAANVSGVAPKNTAGLPVLPDEADSAKPESSPRDAKSLILSGEVIAVLGLAPPGQPAMPASIVATPQSDKVAAIASLAAFVFKYRASPT